MNSHAFNTRGLNAGVEPRRPVTLTLTISPELDEMLVRLSERMSIPKGTVIAQAVVLLNVATEAVREGKAVGVAAQPEQLETEFVGL